jgi:hypothetical protein
LDNILHYILIISTLVTIRRLLLKIAEGLEDAGAKNVMGDLEITRDAISAGREIDSEEAVWRITPILVAAEANQGMIKENGHLYKKVSPPLGGCINQPRCDQGKWTPVQEGKPPSWWLHKPTKV